MTLKREVYEALKNVVGPENISEDSAMIQSYYFQYMHGPVPSKFIPAGAEAVVLPRSAEEVEAIVKICNRYKVGFKAHSTGWGSHTVPIRKGSVLLDLRRMDKIIKIDERNMYAIIEPYVTARELQAEAMKKGLTCHVIGAGCQCSPLASSTSHLGVGVTANTMSMNARNLLGFEWVTPTGEIVTTGLVEDGKLGDPGPSLRGVIRGYTGLQGGLGVFTKVAVKLYPWPGQTVPEVTGSSPKYGWKIPSNIKIYLLKFPSWENLSDACYRLNEEQIAYILWSYSPNNLVLGVSFSNNNYYELWKVLEEAGEIEKNRHPLQVMIAADSKKELEYKEKVLKDILDETGAEDFLPAFVSEDLKEFCYALFVTQYCHGIIFRPTGEFNTSYGQYVAWDDDMKNAKACHELRSKYIKEGKFVNDGFENMWGGPEEQFIYGHIEGLYIADSTDPESQRAAFNHLSETDEESFEHKRFGTGSLAALFVPAFLMPEKISNLFYPWVKKIKDVFDPNGLSEGQIFLEPQHLPEEVMEWMKLMGMA